MTRLRHQRERQHQCGSATRTSIRKGANNRESSPTTPSSVPRRNDAARPYICTGPEPPWTLDRCAQTEED